MKRILLLIVFCVFATSLIAQTTYTWKGTVSSDWNNSGNWLPVGVPGATDNIIILTAANSCQLSANSGIANITVTNGTIDLGGNTLTIGGTTATFTAGTVQNGNITVSGAVTTTFGSGVVNMNCIVNITSATITVRNTSFQNTVNITKTGTTNDVSAGNNIFNGATTITNAGAGFLSLANGFPDQFNAAATFNNTGSSSLYVAYNSSNNIFNGVTTFNNVPTANTFIYVSWYSAGTLFNDDIAVSSSGGQGVQFCGGNSTATATLAATKTIAVGAGGFSAGSLLLRQFTQSSNAPINVAATGTAVVNLGPVCNFGGALTVSSPNIYAAASTFNGAVVFNKTDGTTSNASTGGNTFNSTLTVNYISTNGTSYWSFANGVRDVYNGDVYSNNNSLDRIIFGHNSANNLFNSNFIATQTGASKGTALTWNTGASCVMAAGKTLSVGAAGFNTGYFYLQGFTQNGLVPVDITTTGSSSVYVGTGVSNNPSVIGGNFTVNAPDIYLRGSTFNGAVIVTKTGGVSNHNNSFQNIFNGTCIINQQSNGGYFGLGYNSNDLFNDDITVTSTGTGGIYLGLTSGTGTPTLAAGKTIAVGAAGFNAGFLSLNGFTQLGSSAISLAFTGVNTYMLIGKSSAIAGDLTVVSPRILLNGAIYSGNVNITKTGGTGDWSAGNNTFNGTTTINNLGTALFGFGNAAPDIFNGDLYVNNNSTDRINFGNNSIGNQFNGNIILTQTGASTGIGFGGTATTSETFAAGKTITIGAAGFSTGALQFSQFTQLGNTPVNLPLTGTSSLTVGPASAIGGNFVSTSASLFLNGCNFGGTVDATKTGTTNDAGNGNNIFNGNTVINNTGAGYLALGNNNPDTWNSDVTFNNSGADHILPCWNSAGNQFNGNIFVTNTGSAKGIHFCSNAVATATIATTKNIQLGATGFHAGSLLLPRFTQLGSAAISMVFTGTNTLLQVGPAAAFGGNFTVVSPRILLNGAIFSGNVTFTKNGATGEWSSGGNTFNGTTTINQLGAGFFGFANGAPDIYNGDLYINNNSTERVIFGNSSAVNQFNGNIILTQTGASLGIAFGWNATTTQTMAAGKTISIGSAGFDAGYLQIARFIQSGNIPMSLMLPGATTSLTFGPAAAIGGDLVSESASLFFNGCTFGGKVNSSKTGATNDGSSGNNIFNGAFEVTNTGAGYFMMGNGNPDIWQSTAVFNNFSTAQHLYTANNSTGNIFNGDVVFNNQPGSIGLWIYPNAAGAGTQFNGNISVTNLNGGGVYFGSGTGTAVLAAGKQISVGGIFNYGGLIFKNFSQAGAAGTHNITTSGASYIRFGPNVSFDGAITSSSPGLFFNGGIFNGTVNCSKTGSTNDQSTGDNIFNGASTFTNNSTGYLMMGSANADAYNSDVTFIKTSTGLVYPNYNSNSTYAGSLTINSVTPITFGAGTGTATLNGSGTQNINAVAGSVPPVFSRLVIANTGAGVVLNNTAISVSNNLALTSGLLHTTTANILTMLNGSATTAGNALSVSYVDGPMRYQKSTSGMSVLNFPVGNGADSRPVVLTVNHTTNNLYTYQAQLFNASAKALAYTLPLSVDKVSAVHYYTINRLNAAFVSQPTLELSGTQTIQVFFGANDVVTDGSTLTIVKNTPANLTKWSDIGGAGAPPYNAGANLTGSISSTSTPSVFNSFSTFALGNLNAGVNILPLHLLYFNARAVNGKVALSWATSSESGNSYFTIEKSSDAVSFVPVQQVASKALNGNSEITLNYNVTDADPSGGISYYRLKQTALSGRYVYSDIASVNFEKSQTISVYPNPSKGIVYISGLDKAGNNISVEWYNISGKRVLQQTAQVNNGQAKLTTQLGNGLYIVRIKNADGSYAERNVMIVR